MKFAGDVENGVKHNKMCFEILVTPFFGQNDCKNLYFLHTKSTKSVLKDVKNVFFLRKSTTKLWSRNNSEIQPRHCCGCFIDLGRLKKWQSNTFLNRVKWAL